MHRLLPFAFAALTTSFATSSFAAMDASAEAASEGALTPRGVELSTIISAFTRLRAGHEIHSSSIESAAATPSASLTPAGGSFRGLELADLQVGGNFRLAPHVGVGPYAAVTLAQFSSSTSDAGDCALAAKTLHAWLLGGVRGVFDV